MPLVDHLLLILMKLKLNCGRVDLATRFNCSTATVTNVFITITSALHDILYVGMMESNISTAKNQTSLLACFQPFPNCRMSSDWCYSSWGNYLCQWHVWWECLRQGNNS